ncbi:MAG: GlsB/YeaQ/YmgE family stress response membrane protein [Candidatus Pacebacteria bacterium]|nr:GlsB/YeaQ/YmgE family stress response membrane protein [Candidatus Paceibacterota bacterium]
MELLAFLVLGGIAGWIASLIMGTDASQGIFLNIVVGVVGAFIGGMLFNAFGTSGVTGFNIYSLVVAVLGAVVLLFIVRLFRSV